MSPHIEWRDFDGKKVLFLDFKGLKGDHLLEAIAEVELFFKKTPPDKSKLLLLLTDVTKTVIDTKVMGRFKEMNNGITGYDFKSAVVGVTATKKALLNTMNFIMGKTMQAFDSQEKALEWLFG